MHRCHRLSIALQANLAVAKAAFSFYQALLGVAREHRTRLAAAGALEIAFRAMDQSAAALSAVHEAGGLNDDKHDTAVSTLRGCFALLTYMLEDCRPDDHITKRALNAGALEAAICAIAQQNADAEFVCWACSMIACLLRGDAPRSAVRQRAVEAGVIEVFGLTRFVHIALHCHGLLLLCYRLL